MRAISILINAPNDHQQIFEQFAREMGFLFITSADTISQTQSVVIWGGNVTADYYVTVDAASLKMTSSRNTRLLSDVKTSDMISLVKRFVLDEESAFYITKTQNQIGGAFQKMKRLFRFEGIGKRNKFLVQNLHTHTIQIGSGSMKNTKITIYGVNNTLIIEDGFQINHMELLIRGNGNIVKIGKKFELNYNTDHGPLYLSAKDDNNTITLGNNIHIRGSAEIVCMEGTELTIGDNFGMSNETIIRTGDGHRIMDLLGNRVNPSRSIKIGNDCWLARRGIILKGVELKDYTIVGTGALVTKSYDSGNIILGGNPAKVIKENVTWLPGR